MRAPEKTKKIFKTADDLVDAASTEQAQLQLKDDKDKKMVVSIPESLHKKVKIFSVENGITIRSFVIDAMERSLKEGRK